jgi:formate hydrogenlyase subunit 3/multisubunit Na+/H+ antiporter MnhD subunit
MKLFDIPLYYWIIFVPVAAGFLGFLFNRMRTLLNFVGFIASLYFAIQIFVFTRTGTDIHSFATISGIEFRFYLDNLTGVILLFNAVLALLIWFYSLRAMTTVPRERVYYLDLALSLSAANGTVLAGNLVFMLIFWNVLVFSLYGLLLVGKTDSSLAARKAITIIGIADYVLMLGIVILLINIGNANFPIHPRIALNNPWLITSFILIAIGALAKLGTMPFHTWIPESAKTVPASTLAYIPGSLDKLLGFYLLLRIALYIFDITQSMSLRLLFMIVGVITIVIMAFAALMQKDAQRLLAFSTVSQAGYMVLGLGTGVPIAIAGAFFHMLNNVLYKSTLFLGTGAVENRVKTTNLDDMGGLAVKMPVTFFAFAIAALAISGVPPLNGFYSKWMIYQGIIDLQSEMPLWFIFLICAMFGSILTLAYNLKLVHSIFLGERPKTFSKVREARFELVAPPFVLAVACIVFGIFAVGVPLKHLVLPALPFSIQEIGFWSPDLATLLIIVGLVVGLLLFLLGTALKPKKGTIFIGGEILDEEAARITGADFYSSMRSLNLIEKTSTFGEGGAFDIYNYIRATAQGIASVFKDVVNQVIVALYRYIGKLVQSLGGIISVLHTGELYNYVGWIFIGGIILIIILVF